MRWDNLNRTALSQVILRLSHIRGGAKQGLAAVQPECETRNHTKAYNAMEPCIISLNRFRDFPSSPTSWNPL